MVDVDTTASPMERRVEQAEDIVKLHSVIAGGIGFVPMPLINFVGVTAVQLRMLSKLADHYDVPFSGNVGKTVIASLLGGLVPPSLRSSTIGIIASQPLVGGLLGALTLPAFAAATTYAMGTAFSNHFKLGGRIENLDTGATREQVRAVLAGAENDAPKIETPPEEPLPAKPGRGTGKRRAVEHTGEPLPVTSRPAGKKTAAKRTRCARKVARSAISGRFVTKSFADANPDTTVVETMKPSSGNKEET